MFPQEAVVWLMGVITKKTPFAWGDAVENVSKVGLYISGLLAKVPTPPTTYAAAPLVMNAEPSEEHHQNTEQLKELHTALAIDPNILGFIGQFLLTLLDRFFPAKS